MSISIGDRRQTILSGLSGMAKMLILIVGVPLALVRLWLLTPVDASVFKIQTFESLRVWARLFLLAIVVLWLIAAFRLLRELLAALLHRQQRPGTSWSIKWATQIAGLLLLASTSSLLAGHLSSTASTRTSSLQVTRQNLEQAASRSTPPVAAIDDCFAPPNEPEVAASDRYLFDTTVDESTTNRESERDSPLDSAYIQWCFGDEGATDSRVHATSSSVNPHSLHDLWLALELSGVGAVIVASLARRLRFLRRLNASARMPREHVEVAPPRIAQTDALLRSFCESPVIEWLETANRLLWKVLRERHRAIVVPDIRLVRCGPDGIEFLLATPLDEAPLPFVSTTGGYWWKLAPTSFAPEWQIESTGYGRFLPNLVPVGEDASATYLVPIGPTRCLGILGDNQSIDGVLRAIVLGLRTLPWADELEIELLGPSVPPPAERAFHLHGSNVTILKDLSRTARHLPKERLSTDWSREPLVVLGRDAFESSTEIVLEELSSSVGVIVAGVSGTETLVVDDGRAILSPYGIELTVPVLNEEVGCLADALLAHYGSPPSKGSGQLETAVASDITEQHSVHRGTTELHLLCERPYLEHVAVSHAEPLASRVTELVAYLTLHDRRATIDELGAAMYPVNAVIPTAQITRLCSAARHALGHGIDGHSLVSVSDDGVVRLDQSVTTDWHRVKYAVTLAPSLEPVQAVDLLSGVLQLVEADPLSRVRIGFAWLIASGAVEEMQETIVDAAHHCANLSLAMGQDAQAAWAIEQACLVTSNSEILVRDTMAICDARGDIVGLEAAYFSLERGLATLNAEPSLETAELFQSLRMNMTRNRPAAELTRDQGSTPPPQS